MRVGFIGAGNMGGPMAGHVSAAGHELAVHDLRADALDELEAGGARRATSAADAAAGAEVVCLSLPTPDDVEAVTTGEGGVLAAMDEGAILVDLTTSSPTTSRNLAAVFAEQGRTFLDAPISGGVRGARKGVLTVMVGGAAEDVATVTPVLETFAANVVRCGDVGTGNVVKLVNNMLAFVNMLGMLEGLVLGSKAGVDPEVLREVVSTSSGDSFVWGGGTAAVLRDSLPPTFTTTLAAKDISLAEALATEFDVPVPMGGRAAELLRLYRDTGFADDDILATVQALEDEADFLVRGSAPNAGRS